VPIELPEDDQVTLRWVIDKMPVRWWIALLGAASVLTATGYAVATATHVQCSVTELDALRDKRDALANGNADLEAKRQTLQAQVSRLEVEKRIDSMTPAQVREGLKKWSRD
jgi:uncharacterized protein YlxW (UPF0749 family)